MEQITDQKPGRRSAWRRTLSALGVFVLFTGMLFWTKLRLVSDIPRSAYAVPKEEMPDDEQATPTTVTDQELDRDDPDDRDEDIEQNDD